MIGRIPVAFLAGLVSFLAPCVLPLVPGYLSAVSAVDAGRLGERGVARRVVISSIPFVLGFTAVFVALGTGVAAAGGLLPTRSQEEIAGFVVVVFGFAFMGPLPWPERLVAPGLMSRARAALPRHRRRVQPGDGRLPVASRSVHGDPGRERRDPRRARPPALLRPLLVAARGRQPRPVGRGPFGLEPRRGQVE